ncbi:MAG: PDZ domain-containing protein [Armatimonadota bacterium]
MTKSVSGPVAVLLIFLVILVSAALFHNARLAPPETGEPPRPPEPTVEETEVATLRRNLKPLGVTAVMAPLTEDRGKGVRIAAVLMDSPAQKAGIQMGDLIERFDGELTVHPMVLVMTLAKVKEGQAVKAVIDRSGKKLTLTITGIIPLPPEEQVRP